MRFAVCGVSCSIPRFKAKGLELKAAGVGFGVSDSGFMVDSIGLMVYGMEVKDFVRELVEHRSGFRP